MTPEELQARLKAAIDAYLDSEQDVDEDDDAYAEREAALKADKIVAAEAVGRAFEAEYAALIARWPFVRLDWGCGCCSSGHRVGGDYMSLSV